MIVGFLMGKDLSRSAAVALCYIVLAVVFFVLFAFAVVRYGNMRYEDGVDDTDAKWEEASDRLVDQARASEDRADQREAERIEDHTAAVAAEKERIDEAVTAGRSPLDVLFPAR